MANFYLTGIGSLTGALATGLGFLVTASLQKSAFAAVSSQRAIVVLYAAMNRARRYVREIVARA